MLRVVLRPAFAPASQSKAGVLCVQAGHCTAVQLQHGGFSASHRACVCCCVFHCCVLHCSVASVVYSYVLPWMSERCVGMSIFAAWARPSPALQVCCIRAGWAAHLSFSCMQHGLEGCAYVDGLTASALAWGTWVSSLTRSGSHLLHACRRQQRSAALLGTTAACFCAVRSC